ncbi:bone morphogenetic protein 2 [Apis laboriosa]|uniref:bone morphogenetic protein 2 n=1 Tax=Apis laboriosa TaxID=183418 RepID=UPI001CC6B29F|nr:bone morphogenetic protein 2 [Apis laboriosa]
MRGKLATRGRLVTRDNEGQEEEKRKKKAKAKASVRSLERDSGRARVAPLPIRGTTIPRIGRTEAAVSIEGTATPPLSRVIEDRPRIASIETAPVDKRHHHHRYHHRHRHYRHHHYHHHHHHQHRHRHRIFERDYRWRIVGREKWTNEEEKNGGGGGDRCRSVIKIDGSSISRLFGIATLVAVAVALFVPIASPVPLSGTGPRHEDDLHRFTGLEDVYEDVFREEDRATTSRSIVDVLDETELDIIRRSIARGLGLERIPDPSKANVSQAEYERAHREYLMRIQSSFSNEATTFGSEKKLHVFPATAYPGNVSTETSEREKPYRHCLFFPVEKDLDRATVDHATLRLLLHGPTTDQYYSQPSELDVLLYLGVSSFPRRSIRLIDRTRIRLEDWRNSKWLELDATLAVSSWIDAPLSNLGLELEFLLDGETVTRTFSSPVLNVFTATPFTSTTALRRKRSSPEQVMSLHRSRRTKCKGEGKKCCRHELTVMFKDLEGFEFIVYPKTFDAGYCKGRCPPRYNPAHHHALLQSLLWKEDRKKVPKPCCAPSKLDQLMIVYLDENNSTRLKVSDWKNIQVLECACS